MAAVDVVDIDPRGDVVLAVGQQDDGQPIERLRVSSAVLRLTSPAFAVLLGPHFKEGQTLSATSRVEIPLPEDNVEAMRSLCLMLHMQHNQLSPTAKEFLEIAKLSDKVT
ncbi:hypothetical protein HII31_06260 [Pseudocercospora fuligena]|uniref:BTB domain-containing protein n=1 Tax=Pseudocercospora fuligena TaxID=685502 RepID=A0A8H6RJE7_9PEZI|nr:hypothetical protein HII31_06260 [Pseudocercospora fuligena]